MTLSNFKDCVTHDEFLNIMLGKPYRDRCCHVEAVDCWGLVVLYHRMVMGVNIHHSDDYSMGGDFSTCFDDEVIFWSDTGNPIAGDVIVAYRGSMPVHVGLYCCHDKMLHAREGSAVRFDRIKTLERLSTKLRFLTYANN